MQAWKLHQLASVSKTACHFRHSTTLARVITWQHEAGGDFMTVDTTGAVTREVLKEANTVLVDGQILPMVRGWEYAAAFTGEDECVPVTDHWNRRRPSNLDTTGQIGPSEPSRFCRWLPFDDFIRRLAIDVRAALGGEDIPRRYVVLNNENSYSRGYHWVTVVYEILRVEESSPQSSAGRAALVLTSAQPERGESSTVSLFLQSSAGTTSSHQVGSVVVPPFTPTSLDFCSGHGSGTFRRGACNLRGFLDLGLSCGIHSGVLGPGIPGIPGAQRPAHRRSLRRAPGRFKHTRGYVGHLLGPSRPAWLQSAPVYCHKLNLHVKLKKSAELGMGFVSCCLVVKLR